MSKFSKEFRMKLILELEDGQPLKAVARKYGVGRNTVRTWWCNYNAAVASSS
jgi:transposase-like protein